MKRKKSCVKIKYFKRIVALRGKNPLNRFANLKKVSFCKQSCNLGKKSRQLKTFKKDHVTSV